MPVDQALFPVNLIVAGRRCVVVGGGPVAARKAAGLAGAGAVVHVVATEVGPAVRAMGDAVTWEERPYRPEDLAGARLVVTATDSAEVNATVFADAEAAGIWVNSADDPANCSFILPAVVRQGPVVVSVGTSGHSPALATWLKEHVAGELGPEWATLALLLSEARDRVRAAGRSTEDIDWRALLDWSMLDEIKAGRSALVRERLEACLSSS